MAPKKPASSSTTGKLGGVAGLRGRQWRGARAARPQVQAGPYQSTPKRDKARAAVAPRNILGEHEAVASSAAKGSPHLLQAGKKETPREPLLAGDSKSSSRVSLSKSPVAMTTKTKKPSRATKPTPIKFGPPPKTTVHSSIAGRPVTSGRATPASSPRALSSPAAGSDSARRLRSYSHSLRRSLYAPASKIRASSLRRSLTGDASPSLSASKTVLPSTLHASFMKGKNTSPPKLSQARAALPRRSLGVIDASFARHSLVNTALQTSADGDGHSTPFRARAPKVACRGPEAQPRQDCSKEELALWDKQIKSWLNKPWKLCCLSAMASFDIQKANLRSSYQKALRNRIDELLPFSVQVEIETVHCFTRNRHITDAVVITISYSIPREWDLRKSPRNINKGESSEPRRVLYKSLMIRALLSDSQADRAGVSWYPLYFYSGRQRLHQAVEQWLSDSFGACVSLKSLQTTALLWAAGLWCKQSCGVKLSKPVPVSLSYVLAGLSSDGWQQHSLYPSSARVKDSSFLTLEVPADQMRSLALCVLPESDEACITEAERDYFHSVVQQLVGNLTCLPLSALRLLSVKTSCVALTRNGQIKVSCKQHFLGLLQWLLELHREDSLLEQAADVDYLSQDLDDGELNNNCQ